MAEDGVVGRKQRQRGTQMPSTVPAEDVASLPGIVEARGDLDLGVTS